LRYTISHYKLSFWAAASALWALAAAVRARPSPLHNIREALASKWYCYEEFLNASQWYFVGLPPAFGGRQPCAQAAASPVGWPPPKPLSSLKRFLIANGI